MIDDNHDEAIDSFSFVLLCVCSALSGKMVLGKNVKSELPFFLFYCYVLYVTLGLVGLKEHRLVRHLDPCLRLKSM